MSKHHIWDLPSQMPIKPPLLSMHSMGGWAPSLQFLILSACIWNIINVFLPEGGILLRTCAFSPEEANVRNSELFNSLLWNSPSFSPLSLFLQKVVDESVSNQTINLFERGVTREVVVNTGVFPFLWELLGNVGC